MLCEILAVEHLIIKAWVTKYLMHGPGLANKTADTRNELLHGWKLGFQ